MKPLRTPRTEHRALLPGGPTQTPSLLAHFQVLAATGRSSCGGEGAAAGQRAVLRTTATARPPATSSLAPRDLGARN